MDTLKRTLAEKASTLEVPKYEICIHIQHPIDWSSNWNIFDEQIWNCIDLGEYSVSQLNQEHSMEQLPPNTWNLNVSSRLRKFTHPNPDLLLPLNNVPHYIQAPTR